MSSGQRTGTRGRASHPWRIARARGRCRSAGGGGGAVPEEVERPHGVGALRNHGEHHARRKPQVALSSGVRRPPRVSVRAEQVSRRPE